MVNGQGSRLKAQGSRLKAQGLGEESRKYARMQSSWAYSRFYELLQSILSNRGIELITVNPAYSSLIGLVKYMKMYALSSDCAAALVIARRGMRLDDLPQSSITAYASVNEAKQLDLIVKLLIKIIHHWSFI